MDSQTLVIFSWIVWAVRIVVAAGLATLFVAALRKIRSLKRDNRRLYELATRDGLTELRSRGWFQVNYPRFVERANYPGHCLGLVMADINSFKVINDTYGHPAGDEVIRFVARMLEAACRPGDAIVRYGGEEFVLILPDAPTRVVERVCRVAEETIRNTPVTLLEGHVIQVTVSFGGISRPGPKIEGPQLLRWADDRLLRAKDLKGSGAPTIVADSSRQRAPRWGVALPIDVATPDPEE